MPPPSSEALTRLGDSLLVVGEEQALKVHVHTDDPGAALSAATAVGVIDEVEIADMYAQTAAREARLQEAPRRPAALPAFETGVVAVADGAGSRELFEAEHATVIEGGQTTNPSVGEIVEAIDATPAEGVIVLPNNSNVILAAEEAAKLASKPVRVVPSRSVQAGLAAIMTYLSTSSLDDNETEMLEALRLRLDGRGDPLPHATSSSTGSRSGKAPISASWTGPPSPAMTTSSRSPIEVVERVLQGERTHLDLVVGQDAPPVEPFLEALRRSHPDVERSSLLTWEGRRTTRSSSSPSDRCRRDPCAARRGLGRLSRLSRLPARPRPRESRSSGRLRWAARRHPPPPSSEPTSS